MIFNLIKFRIKINYFELKEAQFMHTAQSANKAADKQNGGQVSAE